MAIAYRKKRLVLSESVGVEDAEALLSWLQGQSEVKVDLSACEHLHPANLHVLLAAGVRVQAWPRNTELAQWLQTILS
jgi:hypothetical protein